MLLYFTGGIENRGETIHGTQFIDGISKGN